MERRLRVSRVLSAVIGASGALACGAPGLAVPTHPHPEGASAEVVGYMPPAAQIEHLDGAPPARSCLWADGQWVWGAQSWAWRPGAWVRPPLGCRYSAPTFAWAASASSSGMGERRGVLYYWPGRWYSVSEPKVCSEAIVTCPAPSPPGSPLPIARSTEGSFQP
jgi:hypothetical protein